MKRHRVVTISRSAVKLPIALLAGMGVALLSACPSTPEDSSAPGQLQAGAAVRLLELPIGHSTAGYTQTAALGTKHPADDPGSPFADLFPATRGVETPASARVIALDNGNDKLVLARLDLIYITSELTARVVREVRERFGIDIEGKLLLNATHTHGTGHRASKHSILPDMALVASLPEEGRHALAHGGDTYSEESMARIAVPTAEAIGEAFAGLRPARIGWGITENHTAARDRRCENSWIYGPDNFNPNVTVLRVDDAESGSPIAVAFHYSAHGTITGSTTRNLSVCGVGHAEFKVEELFDEPVVAVFLQGTAGDVSPGTGGRGHGGTQRMERYAWDLAGSVMEAYETIETRDVVSLQAMERWVPISYDLLGYDFDSDEFFYDGAVLCSVLYGGCDIEGPDSPDNVLCAGPAVPEGGKYHTLLAAARIDGLHLVTMPGEALTGLGQAVVDAAADRGAEHTLVLGFAMDHNGYLLDQDDWLSGGYEPTITFWGWRFGPYLIQQSIDLIQEMLTGQADHSHQLRELPDFEPEPFEPVKPTRSDRTPAVDGDAPATVSRLAEVVLSFFGGDPALGLPEVTIETKADDGEFRPYLVGGWRPLSNHRGNGLPIRYESSPTYKESPEASERMHRYEVVWEILPHMPPGAYRFAVVGEWLDGGEAREYRLHSSEMIVGHSSELSLSARAVSAGDGHEVALVLTYPVEGPRYAQSQGNGGWQLGRFRMIDPMFAAPFVPVWRHGAVHGDALVSSDGGDEVPVSLSFEGADAVAPRTYDPGEGPSFSGVLPGEGPWTVRVPEGVIGDEHGNVNAASLIELTAP